MMDRGGFVSLVAASLAVWSCTKFQTPVTPDAGDGAMGGGGSSGDAGMETAPDVTSAPTCGNAVKEGTEACDDGAAQNTGGYGKCNPNCTRGPYCGDGMVNGPDEACDSGDANGLGLGACNPACTGTVKQKSIKIFNTFAETGNLTNDWDPFCQTQYGTTYKAVIVDGTTRVASTTPFKGDGQIGWVLQPYTRYLNGNGDLLWTTDQVPLLGVRNGASAPLLASFGGSGSDFAWAGFESDWTTSAFTCGRWNVSSGGGGTTLFLGAAGGPIQITVSDCALRNFVLCAEQ